MIEIEHLNKTYPSPGGDIHALRDVNLRIEDGEIFGIIGLSGAGKSTLVRLLCGTLHPQKGNIVLMGIGEPLDNFDNVMRFLELVNHPDGENIGMRHISLSTCGLIERFDDLAARDLQLTLSVSLHAPDDETRSKIMPANRGRGVQALIDACARYYQATGRRISFEYAMIDGVNDTPEHARLLAKHARRVCAHVNLIPLNHVEERAFRPSTPEHLKAFIRILEQAGVNVTVRRKLGSDVDASCGQLRKKVADHRA